MNCLCYSFVFKKFIIPSEKKNGTNEMFHCQSKILLSILPSMRPEERLLIVACNVNPIIDSLQCRRILVGRNLVHVRIP